MDKGGTSGPHVAGPLAPTLGAWLLGRWHSGRSAPLFHRLAIFGCDRRRSRRRLSDIAKDKRVAFLQEYARSPAWQLGDAGNRVTVVH